MEKKKQKICLFNMTFFFQKKRLCKKRKNRKITIKSVRILKKKEKRELKEKQILKNEGKKENVQKHTGIKTKMEAFLKKKTRQRERTNMQKQINL